MPVATRTPARARLEAAAARLAAAGIETARAEAEWLLADATGMGRLALHLALDRPLAPAAARRFARAVARRARREPLQQILGWEGFRGLRLRVTPAVLVPRPETELLVEWALELLPASASRPFVVDVGTGSGCIACAIARERAGARVLALDVSPAALAVAAANVRSLGLGDRVRLAAADLTTAIGPARVDLLVANPPYLPADLLARLAPEVRDHEPRVALAGGPDGLALVRRLVADAPRVLGPGGALVLETAGGAQASEVARLLAQAGLEAVSVRPDLTGTDRFVAGRARPPAG